MMDELPALDVSPPSDRALDAAETLLRGFYLQDMREMHLSNCAFDAAREAAAGAEEHMARAFQIEFPDCPASHSCRAGKLFMRALFLQDEIENRETFLDCFAHDVPDDIFISDVRGAPNTSINDDTRWAMVENIMKSSCNEIDLDPEFATLHVRFWRMHGQKRDGWRSIARRAHRIKVAHMVPTADAQTVDALARYFVAGAERHDEWDREDVQREVNSVLTIVGTYYQAIFDLRDE
ncbi:hypothetical protein ACH9L7_04235 [Haloferax sp. S1W]|uniref:hypothetical protein n=1 Tax=Haloferax sp. S1W TaxID=3377110 RepID=UPI0037C8B399